jgi:hypothetical protein
MLKESAAATRVAAATAAAALRRAPSSHVRQVPSGRYRRTFAATSLRVVRARGNSPRRSRTPAPASEKLNG